MKTLIIITLIIAFIIGFCIFWNQLVKVIEEKENQNNNE